jgi:hypothetical protein
MQSLKGTGIDGCKIKLINKLYINQALTETGSGETKIED